VGLFWEGENLENAVVILTPLGTNNWSAAPNDVVECESAEEAARFIDNGLARELEEDEPRRGQAVYRMADSHYIPPKEEVKPAPEVKKAANADDPIGGDEDGDKDSDGSEVTEDFFGAAEKGLKVFAFKGGYYNVTKNAVAVNEKKLRKADVVKLINNYEQE
jgi:hypothetical protein